ncbi:MAG TPA: NAD(P)-dependent oxidoreductase [Xanthobacteraceae bacterium]|jgi:3-hydroxyisobutyrate dehydrogenase-like beta-hydroxyacid dehydrogenase
MQANAKGTVGVVGLGIMGGAIARNLAAAGWKVIGYDVDAARRRELSAENVEIAATVGALAKAVPVILTSLPQPAALQAVAAEIVTAGVPKRIVADLSTFAIDDKTKAEKALRAAAHVLLDCPLSGTGAQAKTRDLVVYASGESASIAALKPLFTDFAREWRDLGAFGNGMRMKFVANLLVAIHNVASAEAMVLGIKAGLDPKVIFELVKSGAGNSRVFELRAPMMVAGRYDDATMKISVWQKDMAIIRQFAAAVHCPTPLFDATVPIYDAALSHGLGAQDTAAVCAVLEEKAGVHR